MLLASIAGCPSSGKSDPREALAQANSNAPSPIDAGLEPVVDGAPASAGPSESRLSVGSIADRLQIAGLEVDETRQFLDTLKTRLAATDRAAVCELASYPLRVRSNQSEQKIADKAACRAAYDEIFNARVAGAVKTQVFDELFTNWQGVMIGNGEIWLSGVCVDSACSRKTIRLIAINN
jgi:hypothetical protein